MTVTNRKKPLGPAFGQPVLDDSTTVVHYQWLLRVIGRYLDDCGARTAVVLEEPGGFMVAYGHVPASPDLIQTHFSHDRLQALEDEMTLEFKRGSARSAGQYEDSLRALGYELECQRAYYILVGELEDGFLVTYQYLNPVQGYQVRKHMAILGASEQENLRITARARRTVRRHPQRRTLLGFLSR